MYRSLLNVQKGCDRRDNVFGQIVPLASSGSTRGGSMRRLPVGCKVRHTMQFHGHSQDGSAYLRHPMPDGLTGNVGQFLLGPQ